MSIPEENRGFELGTLEGYPSKPRRNNRMLELVEVSQSFSLNQINIDPPERQFCARLDHPEAVDADSVRRRANPFGGVNLTQFTYTHPNRKKTFCGTGCWLECRKVEIPKGESLCFWYRFFRFGNTQNGHNAIALLFTFPEGATQNDPSRKILICDNRHLENQGKNDSGWVQRSVTISSTNVFRGTVRWVMTTGQLVPRNGRPDDRRYALPGSLFLDLIEIQ